MSWPLLLGVPFSLLLVLLIAFSGNIKAWALSRLRKDKRRGRWVRDRSLGGKMVFVSTDEEHGRGGSGALRPRPSALGDIPIEAAAAATRPGGRGVSDRVARPQPERPEWWTFVPPLLVSDGQRRECGRRARRLVRQAEDMKMAQGQDYGMLNLVQIYQACKVCSTVAALFMRGVPHTCAVFPASFTGRKMYNLLQEAKGRVSDVGCRRATQMWWGPCRRKRAATRCCAQQCAAACKRLAAATARWRCLCESSSAASASV